MSKIPWKRSEAEAEPPPLASYLPVQPVDYTALPIVEDEGVAARFWKLPLPARAGVVALPLLLLVIGIWGILALTNGNAQAQEQPKPEIVLNEVRVVNPSQIAIEGVARNVPDGTAVGARLLVDGVALAWVDTGASTGIVEGGRVAFRVRKAVTWTESLAQSATYTVEVLLASQPGASAQAALVVPGPLAVEFFGPELVAVAPSPTLEPTVAPTLQPTAEPTPEPTQEPSPEPTQEPAPEPTVAPVAPTPERGPPVLTAGSDATLWISPALGSSVIAKVAPGTTYQPLLRTPDGQFFLVVDANRAGWLTASQATIDAEQAGRVPLTTPLAEAVAAGPLRATVVNGGNIRFLPSMETGTVLGQMQANQTVTIKGRTASGQWYRVVAPAAEGWTSVTLLSFPADVGAAVPVVEPSEFVPQGFDVAAAPAIAPPPPAPAPAAPVVAAPLAPSPAAPTIASPPPAPAPAAPAKDTPILVTNSGATMLISPVIGTEIVGQPAAGTTFRPLLRTPASTFFLVLEGNHTGWLAASQVTIAAEQVTRVPVTTPSTEAVLAGPLRATVASDGNIRIGPLVTATILGTAGAGETVTVKARTADGAWYRIVAPAAEGWLSGALLGLPPSIATKVPVAN